MTGQAAGTVTGQLDDQPEQVTGAQCIELARRNDGWTPMPPRYMTGVLAKYRKLVSSAADGAVCG